MKSKIIFILLSLCLILTFAGCGGSGSGGGEGGGGEGGGDVFVITDVTPRDGVEDFQVIAGKGIKFTSMGFEWVIQDKVELNNNGTITDTLLLKMDGETAVNSVYTGTWNQSGTTINVHFTKEKDKIAGTTKDIDENGSAELSADGNTLSNKETGGEIPFKYIYKKQ